KKIILLFLAFYAVINFSNAQWQQANGPYGGSVNCMAVKDTSLFAGTMRSGIYKSVDNGTNWIPANTGLPNNTYVTSIFINDTSFFITALGQGVFSQTTVVQAGMQLIMD
ncbi:MAG: hypothetical protein V1904_08520, partial [Bacteroidota bacterium]